MTRRSFFCLSISGSLVFGVGCGSSDLSQHEKERLARLTSGDPHRVMKNDTLWLVADSGSADLFIPYQDAMLDSIFSELGDFARDSAEEARLLKANLHFARGPFGLTTSCWVCDEDFIQAYHGTDMDNVGSLNDQWDMHCKQSAAYELPRRWVRLGLIGGQLYNCALYDQPGRIKIELGDSTYLEERGDWGWEFSRMHSIHTGNGRTWWLFNESSLSQQAMCLCRDDRVVHVIDTVTKLSVWEIPARFGLPAERCIMVPWGHRRDFPILCGTTAQEDDLTAFCERAGVRW